MDPFSQILYLFHTIYRLVANGSLIILYFQATRIVINWALAGCPVNINAITVQSLQIPVALLVGGFLLEKTVPGDDLLHREVAVLLGLFEGLGVWRMVAERL